MFSREDLFQPIWRRALFGLAALVLVIGLGFLLGIVPGLLSGLLGWHKVVAIALPSLWSVGYVLQRAQKFGDVNWITFTIAVLAGLGFGASCWLFGNITS